MDKGKATINKAFNRLEDEADGKFERFIHWIRSPASRWVRIPLGLAIIAVGCFGLALPVVGMEWIPFGILLLAQDIPFLREPAGKFMLWILAKYKAFQKWKRARKARS
jgi:hypothetical protein